MDDDVKQRWTARGVYTFLVACLVGCAIAAVATGFKAIVLTVRGERTTATCTRIEAQRGQRAPGFRLGYVSFTTSDGKLHEAEIDASWSALEPGGTAEILYDPQYPARAENARFASLWCVPLVFGVYTMCGVVLGIGTWRRHSRKQSFAEEAA